MKKVWMLAIALASLTPSQVSAEEADTLKVYDVDEVTVVATPKENKRLRQLPAAVSLLSNRQMRAAQVKSIKSLTAVVPNLFIPDYGSRLTSAVYIRGIGSRINTPSVGLYVDNIPFIDKSAFDFSYADVERIDVLRGPQATLYGRNAMGGLIKVHTKSPFHYQGTDLTLGAATRNGYNASLTHYHRVNERFAFSTGGFYNYEGGFHRNATDHRHMGESQTAGGRFRGIVLPADNWKADFTLSYEYSDQNGYPYLYEGTVNADAQPEELRPYIGTVAHNRPSGYYRNLLNAGVNLEHQADHFTLSAVTGYQLLTDRMALDQDFTPADIFTIEQRQKIHTLSQEVVLKSTPHRRWQWTTGAAAFYQWMQTDGPVDFYSEGIDRLIEGNVNGVFDRLAAEKPMMPRMHLTLHNDRLRIGGSFDTPTANAALFHQSTVNDLFLPGLSLTVGLRLDYERLRMDYHSASTPARFDFNLKMTKPMPMEINLTDLAGEAALTGKESTDYVQLLPKVALMYEWKGGNNVYATASRGYRSGGYNTQMFSDLIQGSLSNAMIDAIAAAPEFANMGSMIDGMKNPLPDVSQAVVYKPEYTWNYEAGTHLNLFGNRLTLDAALFWMQTRDQQLSKFAESGLGRITVNAGRSRSLGAEVAMAAALTDALSLNASYGYTHATFTDYVTNARNAEGSLQEVDYDGNFVPFVPRHTVSAGAQYTIALPNRSWLDAVQLNANYSGAGRIYWTEANERPASQAFYGTLASRVSLQKGKGEINLWVKNLLNDRYTTFYFESMGNRFSQQGAPIQAGIELRCRF